MTLNTYQINKDTLAIVPISKTRTKIYETDNILIVNRNTQKIIEENCQYYGSSFNGRKKGTSDLIGITHKPPIIIEDSSELVFFPTASPRLRECSWIALNNIDTYTSYEKITYIKFENDFILKLPVSPKIVSNQILRATRLESVYQKRRKKLQKSL